MNTISLPAHFDGVHILLDKPCYLKPDAKLIITVVPEIDEEREEWLETSAHRLVDACEQDEVEYPLSSITEVNPHYVRR